MKNDTLLMHRLHGPRIEGYQSQGTNAKCIFILWRGLYRAGANRRNFARITCTPRAMALLSSSRRHIARRRSIIRTIACIQGARLKKKLPRTDWQQNPRRASALSVITERVIRRACSQRRLPRIIIRVIPTKRRLICQ